MRAGSGLARSLVVGFLSAGMLAYEILLVRAFAIEYFHHLASMAIGIAMLGWGASGTLTALAVRRLSARAAGAYRVAAALSAPTLLLSAALAHLVRLDPTQLAVDPRQWVRLCFLYGALALPFVVGGFGILLALLDSPEHTGRTYGASFIGSALGALAAVGSLWFLTPERALAVPALLAAPAAFAAWWPLPRRAGAIAVSAATLALSLVALGRPPWRLAVTPYKGLPQAEAYPSARRVLEHPSPMGWVVGVQAPAFRYAPGLSLEYRGAFPRQTGLFVDGQTAGAVSSWGGEADGRAFLDHLPSALPYALGPPRRALIVGAGGGLEVLSALAHGARRVTALELHPALADAGRQATEAADSGRVEWIIGDARSLIARTRARFDLVTLGAAGALGTATAGVHALDEDFLHTVDAYEAYLGRLTERGVLAITRWTTLPPRDEVRAVLSAFEALRRIVPSRARAGVVVARSWATVTILVRPTGFTREEVETLRSWGAVRAFDLDWYPGIETPSTEFHRVADPVLFRAAEAASKGPSAAVRFADRYPFRVDPVPDDRPYPHHTLRAAFLGTLLRAERGAWLPFAEWGSVALVATLVQSALAGGLLLLAPALLGGGLPGRGAAPLVGYFVAIGIAYVSAELAVIQTLTLLLGHPVFAVAGTLFVFLLASGLGSTWSDRLDPSRTQRILCLLAPSVAVLSATLLGIAHGVQAMPLPIRGLVALGAVAPLAFLMGCPFPLGMRAHAGAEHRRVAWAWAANGLGSVVAAPLAALIALTAGSRALLLAAAAAYLVAGVLGRPSRRRGFG